MATATVEGSPDPNRSQGPSDANADRRQMVRRQSGKTFATYNPATEEKIADVAEGDAADIDLRRQGGPQGVRIGPLAEDGRPRPGPAAQRWPT